MGGKKLNQVLYINVAETEEEIEASCVGEWQNKKSCCCTKFELKLVMQLT